ncbi:TIGR01244 family sulfur transferase [Amphritea sp.]|uniref:TIGR01244 family sulfur transferase n=1 Tax=Amphritea sp. TaxID=1872502 RepID=UPI003A90B3D3
MDIKLLEPGFSICHAIYPSDMKALKAQGFRAIICHRQPGEADDHIDDSALRQAAEAEGIEWVEIPVTPGEYTPAAIEAFGAAIDRLPTPILGFCRSGRRAVSLWVHNQVQQENCDIGQLLQAAHAAGHDLHAEKDSFIKG